MKNQLQSLTGLVTIAIIVLAVNLIAVLLLGGAKLDLTEENLYTLSAGTENILAGLEEPVTAQLYYSKTASADNVGFRRYARRVLDTLRQFEREAGDRLRLEVFDPRPDTEEEENALRYGLRPIGGGMTAEPLFLGLVLRDESGHEKVIPFFNPQREEQLEYDIASAVYAVSHPEKRRVGVVSALDILGDTQPQNPMMRRPEGSQPWTFIRQLRDNYNFEKIEPDADALPEGLDLLVLVHPKDMSDRLRYAIDQYVLGGGRALVFVDPHATVERPPEDMPPQAMMQMQPSSNPSDLLDAWGLEMVSGQGMPAAMGMPAQGDTPMIVADPNLALQVGNRQGGQDSMIVWLGLGDEQINDEEIVTSELENLMVISGGALKKTGTAVDAVFTPLMTTTDAANTIDAMNVRFGANPELLQRQFEPGNEPLVLAYKVSGSFSTAFPDGPPSEEEATQEGEAPAPPEGHLAKSAQPTTLFVVADVDMIADEFSVRSIPFFGQQIVEMLNDNLRFASNAVENLTGSQDLISLRSRGRSARPFTLVQAIQREAQAKYQQREQALQEKLEAANRRLQELQRGGTDRTVLNQELVKEQRQLQTEIANTSRELREVRRMLREEVEALGSRVKIFNIALVPLFVALAGIALAIVKTTRRRISQ